MNLGAERWRSSDDRKLQLGLNWINGGLETATPGSLTRSPGKIRDKRELTIRSCRCNTRMLTRPTEGLSCRTQESPPSSGGGRTTARHFREQSSSGGADR